MIAAVPQNQTSSEPFTLIVQPPQLVVDPVNGNDNNPGTAQLPVATLQKATTLARSLPTGQRIIVAKSGTYTITPGSPWTLSNVNGDSGAPGNPVIYTAAPGATPIVSGGKAIPQSWSVCTGINCPDIPTLNCGGTCTAYVISLAASSYSAVEQLFYNGERRYRPTLPYGSYYIQTSRTCVPAAQASPNCNTIGSCPAGQLQCFDRVGRSASDTVTTYHGIKSPVNSVFIRLFENWTESQLRAAPSNADPNSCTTTAIKICATGKTTSGSTSGQFGPQQNYRYQLENVKEALNQPGQWYEDLCSLTDCSGGPEGTYKLYYLAKNGEDPNTANIVIPQASQLLVMNSIQNVSIIGFQFSYDRYVTPPLGQAAVSHASNIPAAISLIKCSNVIFNFSTFAHLQNWAIEAIGTAVAGIGNTISFNSLFDLGTGAIRLGQIASGSDTASNIAQYNTIINNVLEGGQRILAGGIGLAVWIGNSSNNLVQRNTIYDWYSGAIGVGVTLNNPSTQGLALAANNKVRDNLIYDISKGVTSDEGFVHYATSSALGNEFTGNYMHDMTQDLTGPGHGGNGIYIDQGTSDLLVQNNLVVRVTGACLNDNQQFGGRRVVVDNNIFYGCKDSVIRKGFDETNLAITFTHNLIYFDKGNVDHGPQKSLGNSSSWYCNGASCSTIYAFDNNIWYNSAFDLATNSHAFFTTDGNPNAFNPTYYTFAAWKASINDPHSIVADPKFNGPGFSAGDDYTLQVSSPYASVGFVPFLPYTAVGADLSKVPPYQAVIADAFPTQSLNKDTGF